MEWVASLMGLGQLDTPRRNFLKCRKTIDVSACPGSGKTTLVVAKLAILARKWPYRTRGICVLSHTNAAREQIESRLGNDSIADRLLGYPHYIDTIHGFVNRFLALPWLYSRGRVPTAIDDDATSVFRRRVLGQGFRVVQNFLERKHLSLDQVRIRNPDLEFTVAGKKFPASPTTTSYKRLHRAIQQTVDAGYFCHDEMFVWAHVLIDDFEEVAKWLAHRFPLVLIDEMQDTTRQQGTLLSQVFPRESSSVSVQRIGDPNQEILGLSDSVNEASESYNYPDFENCLDLPSSFRFGPEIARLASPFAVHAVSAEGLRGIGPSTHSKIGPTCKHSIFIFPDGSTKGVLNAFGEHVLAEFDDETLARSRVAAVGHVHRRSPKEKPNKSHYPKYVGDYWEGYSEALTRRDFYPQSLVGHVVAAQELARDGHTLSNAVRKITNGILDLAARVGDTKNLPREAKTHVIIREMLHRAPEALNAYDSLLRELLIDKLTLNPEAWPSVRDRFKLVADALCNRNSGTGRAQQFLAWPNEKDERTALIDSGSKVSDSNVFQCRVGPRCVGIKVGSIHSVKGQTHLATLLLSTYWFKHSGKRLMPWLLGEKENGDQAKQQDRQRLLLSYVAMTRPSHLVCLAISRSALGRSSSFAQNLAILQRSGWQIAELREGVARWMN